MISSHWEVFLIFFLHKMVKAHFNKGCHLCLHCFSTSNPFCYLVVAKNSKNRWRNGRVVLEWGVGPNTPTWNGKLPEPPNRAGSWVRSALQEDCKSIHIWALLTIFWVRSALQEYCVNLSRPSLQSMIQISKKYLTRKLLVGNLNH